MADESTTLPYPNLKVAQYHYQLTNDGLTHLHAEAGKGFWEAVEKDEMAPYLKTISLTPPSSDLISKLEAKNKEELDKLEKKLKDAESELGESEVSEVLRLKAYYLARIGDKENALPALELAIEKTAGLGARIDLVLTAVRLAIFYGETQDVSQQIQRAEKLIDAGGDWDRRNRLKVYKGLYHISIREFKAAAELFIEALSTFTATEVMEYEDFVALTVLSAGVGCDRKGIKTKVLASPEVNGQMSSIPSLASLTTSLNDGRYADFFIALAEVEEQYLTTSPLLAPHARFYVREMRIKAYAQLLESYRSLTMERMCRSFGVSENFMDKDLSRFIASGRLQCTIDKVNGIITTNKLSSENKTAAYEQVIKQGDLLLNEIQKLHRVVG